MIKLKPPLSYYGGKQNLVTEILPMIPTHVQYVEPFMGGGAVFFAKTKSESEVINDLDGRITNFYRVAKTKFHELQTMIQGTCHSEVEYRRAKKMLKSMEGTDVELAWAVWVQCNMSFGHKMFGGVRFCKEGEGINTANKRDNFTEKYLQRLRTTEIFSRDACELIKLKDTPDTFFYCDPPYISSDQGNYIKGYTAEKFSELIYTLSQIKGKFLLSSYPETLLTQAIADEGWNHKMIKQRLSVDGRREVTKYKTECLTWNYPLSQKQLF